MLNNIIARTFLFVNSFLKKIYIDLQKRICSQIIYNCRNSKNGKFYTFRFEENANTDLIGKNKSIYIGNTR